MISKNNENKKGKKYPNWIKIGVYYPLERGQTRYLIIMAKIKPAFEAIDSFQDNSFLVRKFEEVAFSSPYHYHPEFELTLIIKGEGKRYVGNQMTPYAEGDLVLLGPNLPHCWKTEVVKKDQINSNSIVIQFKDDFLGRTLLNKKGMAEVANLLEKSKYGLCFLKKFSKIVEKKIRLLYSENDSFKKIILFLEILNQLGKSKDYILLNQNGLYHGENPTEKARINAVLAYIVENFKKEVFLEEAASIAGLSLNAFCKYYKKSTRKTFMETVIDLRIEFATQLLIQTEKPISEICFDSGFTNVTHFYKTFKKKMMLSPLKYRQKFLFEMK